MYKDSVDHHQAESAGAIQSIIKGGLGRTLFLWILFIALVPLGIVSVVSYKNAYDSMQQDAVESLTAVTRLKNDYITAFFNKLLTDLDFHSQLNANVALLKDLRSAFEASGKTLERFIKSYKWASLTTERDTDLRTLQATYGHYDLLLIDTEGNILFTVMGEDDLGTNIFSGRYADTRFSRACRQAFETGRPVYSDMEAYAPSKNSISSFMVQAIVDQNGDKIGLMAFQVLVEDINNIMQEGTGLGETGETYLVGEDLLMRSDSKFEAESTVLRKRVDTAAFRRWLKEEKEEDAVERLPAAERQSMETPGEGDEAVAAAPEATLHTNYRGVRVLGIVSHLEIMEKMGQNWFMVAEIDEAEAFALSRTLRKIVFILLTVTTMVVLVLAGTITRHIVSPVQMLTHWSQQIASGDLVLRNIDAPKNEIGSLNKSFREVVTALRRMVGDLEQKAEEERKTKEVLENTVKTYVAFVEKVGTGDLTVRVDVDDDGDLGILGNNLNRMTAGLREMAARMDASVKNISSSAREILATTNQQAATTSQQSAAVNQTNVTIQEIRQTSQQADERAGNVARMAQDAASVAAEGLTTVNDTMTGMGRIKEQVEEIAGNILTLSEQTRQIGNIVDTVNDIADQSNLLALNAAIESARAGEAGKGFSVVAGEVRSLAEQSRQATAQVREILEEIQNAANTAVMVTEEGTKRTEAGQQLTRATAEAFGSIGDSIGKMESAARQIAASTRQQSAGMDQVGAAMESIDQAASQTEAGTRQSEAAARGLSELAEQLDDMVKQYKLV